MFRYLIIITVLLINFNLFSQKKFEGILTYKLHLIDSSLNAITPDERMTILTNDSIVRVETLSKMTGFQTQLRHIEKKKTILLIETPKGKFAIQILDTLKSFNKYDWKKSPGKGKIASYKTKNLTVTNKQTKQKFTFSYIPKINSKYLSGFEQFPGLLSTYYISTPEGTYRYELTEIEHVEIKEEAFKVTKDYKLITMDDFISLFTEDENTPR